MRKSHYRRTKSPNFDGIDMNRFVVCIGKTSRFQRPDYGRKFDDADVISLSARDLFERHASDTSSVTVVHFLSISSGLVEWPRQTVGRREVKASKVLISVVFESVGLRRRLDAGLLFPAGVVVAPLLRGCPSPRHVSANCRIQLACHDTAARRPS